MCATLGLLSQSLCLASSERGQQCVNSERQVVSLGLTLVSVLLSVQASQERKERKAVQVWGHRDHVASQDLQVNK